MAEVRVRKSEIDTIVSDGNINYEEWQKIQAKVGAGNTLIVTSDDGTKQLLVKTYAEMEAGLPNNSVAPMALGAEATAPSDIQAHATSLEGEMETVFKELTAAKAKGDKDAETKLKEKLRAMVEQAQALKSKGATYKDLGKYADAAGLGDGKTSFKASVNSGGQAGGGNGAKAGTTGGAAQANSGPAMNFPPSGWGAQTMGGGAAFNSSAYLQSMQTTDNVMASWDEVNKNTNRGKQLMMLFFYFAKMAESGDMGAMYQFMKFITYIVSKDKAKQQIEMGKKLIQLQDLSRQWTNKLLNLQTSATDPNTSNELMKTMTIVKSETDAIATSQKLISQMMEEFAQVVETLTNTTKSALETAGRIMRTVSRFSS